MLERQLRLQLESVFGMPAKFDAPSESFEQDTLFVEIEEIRANMRAPMAHYRATGRLRVFGQRSKAPVGYFARRIESSKPSDRVGLNFLEIDQENLGSAARMVNLCERTCGFVFFYSTEYDPNQGSLTSLEFEGVE